MAPKHSELFVATMRAMDNRDVEAMRELLPAIQQLRCAASGSDASSAPASGALLPRAPSAPAPTTTHSDVDSTHALPGLPPLLIILACEPHAANAQMAGMLLGVGEAADFPDGQPLHVAIVTGQPELVRILLAHGANPNHTTALEGNELTPLHAAVDAINDHDDAAAAADVCGSLLAHGADAMAGAGVTGVTPLQLAATYAQLEVVSALLAHGPAARMLAAADSEGFTALHHALGGGGRCEVRSAPTPTQRAAVVQALLQAGAPVHTASHAMRMTALHGACSRGFPECVALLLAAGAGPLRAAANGILPLHSASMSASPDAWRALEPLVAAGGKATLSTSCGIGPPLVAAVIHGTLEAARELLRLGAPVNQLGSSSAALLCTYQRGISARDAAGWMEARRAGLKVVTTPPEDEVLRFVELLLAHGADPNLRAKLRARGLSVSAAVPKFVTPLINAGYSGHARVVAALLAAGADPRRSTIAGAPLLHEAVAQGHLAVVEVLLQSLELDDINDADSQGASPLHIACHKRSLECVRLLLAAGADPRVTMQGRTPLDLLTAQARGARTPADRRRTELMVNALRRAKEELQKRLGRPRAAAGAAIPPTVPLPAVPLPAVPLPAAHVSAAAPPAATIKACCHCGVLEGTCSVQAGAQGMGMGMGGGSSSQVGAGAAAAVSAAQAPPVKLKRCASCASALYCSAACQRAHWRAGHKEVCAANVARDAIVLERVRDML